MSNLFPSHRQVLGHWLLNSWIICRKSQWTKSSCRFVLFCLIFFIFLGFHLLIVNHFSNTGQNCGLNIAMHCGSWVRKVLVLSSEDPSDGEGHWKREDICLNDKINRRSLLRVLGTMAEQAPTYGYSFSEQGVSLKAWLNLSLTKKHFGQRNRDTSNAEYVRES